LGPIDPKVPPITFDFCKGKGTLIKVIFEGIQNMKTDYTSESGSKSR